jgi:hypothetical protein
MRFTKSKETVIYRNYKKFFDVVPAIGGFIKLILIIGFYLCKPINSVDKELVIINKLFNFQDDN